MMPAHEVSTPSEAVRERPGAARRFVSFVNRLSTAFGVLVGTAVPESWSLEFALPLTFIAIVVPALTDRPALAAAAVAGVIATAAFRWPYGTGLVTAAIAGMAAGVAADRVVGADAAPAESEAP